MRMAVKVNEPGLDQAKELTRTGRVVLDERDDWSEHQPGTAQENDFIAEHGFTAYGRWHLGVDDALPKDSKQHQISFEAW
jgi:hypothetical protein